ncbi:hypothetical protein F4819DRAFT_354125 [Hypoxylon fuscum]|nr:hypothetical protein F4819DRAFT_354125 [Hypoxylon fuscum]
MAFSWPIISLCSRLQRCRSLSYFIVYAFIYEPIIIRKCFQLIKTIYTKVTKDNIMSATQNKNTAEPITGTCYIFGCGHSFISATESTPILNPELEDHLLCPLCHLKECLNCGAAYSGWLDSCDSCDSFCLFSAVADDVLSKGIHKIHFKHGIVMIPSIGDELSKIGGWTEALSLGVGYVHFDEEVDENGEIYASEELELQLSEVSRLDAQGKTSSSCPSEPSRIKLHIVSTGVIPQSEREYDFIKLV